MSFQEVIGQEAAIALLKNAFSQKRCSHAYCFVGPDGVGKKKTAFNFARLLLCEKVERDVPCGICASCRKVDSLSHPDLLCVEPDGQFIKIDAVREACRRLNLKGFESSRKVLIISQAQSLNEESSNALLKTLEEPTADTVIILLVDSLKSVLPTIRSRCQRVVFQALTQQALEGILKERYKLSEDETLYLGRLAAGRLGMALQYHETRLFLRKNKILDNALGSQEPYDKFLGGSSERSQKNLATEEFLCVLSSWFRDLLLAKADIAPKNFINVDRKDDIIAASRRYTMEEIEHRIAAIAEAAQEMTRHINTRISMANLRMELWK